MIEPVHSGIGGCPYCVGGHSKLEVQTDESGNPIAFDRGVECGFCQGRGYAIWCPLCESESFDDFEDMDFHHWDYDLDIGVLLCRSCHEQIHQHKRASEQGNWKKKTYENLILAHEKHHGEIEDWETFWERYNLTEMDFAEKE